MPKSCDKQHDFFFFFNFKSINMRQKQHILPSMQLFCCYGCMSSAADFACCHTEEIHSKFLLVSFVLCVGQKAKKDLQENQHIVLCIQNCSVFFSPALSLTHTLSLCTLSLACAGLQCERRTTLASYFQIWLQCLINMSYYVDICDDLMLVPWKAGVRRGPVEPWHRAPVRRCIREGRLSDWQLKSPQTGWTGDLLFLCRS